MSVDGFSEDCLSRPAVTHDYTPRGEYVDIDGFKTYITGPSKPSSAGPTRAILTVYDIFGFASQMLQGADRLADQVSAAVIVPDFFKGEEYPQWAKAADTPEKKTVYQKFFNETANTGTASGFVAQIRAAIAKSAPSTSGGSSGLGLLSKVQGWAILGLCWGGKVAILASTARDSTGQASWLASGQVHPGFLDIENVQSLTTPHICLFSQRDGEPEVMQAYEEALKKRASQSEPGKPSATDVHVERYSTQVHGWMGARAFGAGEESVKEYERGYDAVGNFFAKYFTHAVI